MENHKECLSHRRNWVPLLPPPQASVSPPLDPKGETGESNILLRVKGGGEPNSDDWIEAWHSESVYSVGGRLIHSDYTHMQLLVP
jgi:hypothetical protein